jgi:hypothetical protein
MKNDLYAAIESYFGITQCNLDFKYRINRLNYFQVYSGIKTLHSLPRVAIALAEAQATDFFLTNRNLTRNNFICGG